MGFINNTNQMLVISKWKQTKQIICDRILLEFSSELQPPDRSQAVLYNVQGNIICAKNMND